MSAFLHNFGSSTRLLKKGLNCKNHLMHDQQPHMDGYCSVDLENDHDVVFFFFFFFLSVNGTKDKLTSL